ncbi:hypothetical protein [Amycolatopsis australiensis]|uniref:hypothetical protein n=1 Tax=Amycolatopsis australiensis TaxID=546364 RepID=UPI000930357C
MLGQVGTAAKIPVIEALRGEGDRVGLVGLVDLARHSGVLVFASHADELVRALCTTAVWMDEGRVHTSGSPDHVLAAYANR